MTPSEQARKEAEELFWADASCVQDICGKDAVERIAQALLLAEKRGAEVEREECAKVAESEPVLEGDAPPEVLQAVKQVGIEEAMRCVCRGTISSIAKAIRNRSKSREWRE